MPFDGKEPESIWHDPREQRDQFAQQQFAQPSVDQPQAIDRGEASPPPDAQSSEVLHLSNPAASLEEEDLDNLVDDDVDAAAEPASTMSDLLHNLGHSITSIAAPLLFGALTSLFVLPLVANGRAYIPPPGLLIVTAIIILIAVAQEVAAYLAGSNNSLWAIVTLAGFSLFVLVGTFTIFGPLVAFLVLVLLLLIYALLARFYLHRVSEGFVDITFSSGKYARTLYPGVNVRLPWESIEYHLNVRETQWICPEQRIQLSREEDVILRAAITYQLLPEDAQLAVLQVNNWEQKLREDFITLIQMIATTFSPNDFLTWPQGLHAAPAVVAEIDDPLQAGPRWERINEYLFQQMRDQVALWGVQIRWVRIRDVMLVPHNIPRVDVEPTLQTPSVKAESEMATASVGARASATTEQRQAAPAKAPASSSSSASPQKAPSARPNEEILTQAYNAVQNGKITDPETIRGIAAQFQDIANDPTWSQMVDFDAARAARNLRDQAQRNEERFGSGNIYNDKTQTDWTTRRPTDENLMGGG